ncbi:unnamed protein product [Brachionus calyciflorus]|uniref:Uncharacterized protein n=1 Tax=Brachionus calyciflorus TaxID=104777 RepID=A0A813U4H1_9BILA|nr:unnamed protein product [Brachionus calyciflorus]
MKFVEICECPDIDKILDWLQEKNLLPSMLICQCGKKCERKIREDVVDGRVWRCSCGRRKSIRTNSFFSQFSLSLKIILKLILYLALQMKQIDQAKLLGISRPTIISFQQRLRLIAC